jgi:hypothetical protein
MQKKQIIHNKQEAMGKETQNCLISKSAERTRSSASRSMKKQVTITHDLFQKYEQQWSLNPSEHQCL